MKQVSSSFRKALLIITVLSLTLLTSGLAFAQAGSSSLRGTISDLQGRAVAGAQVTLINEQKNFRRTYTTNDDGAYVFTPIPPDTYRLEVEATGFKKSVVPSLTAQTDTPASFDVEMEVGNIAEIVSVIAGADAPINITTRMRSLSSQTKRSAMSRMTRQSATASTPAAFVLTRPHRPRRTPTWSSWTSI
jgi:hypothetical protein